MGVNYVFDNVADEYIEVTCWTGNENYYQQGYSVPHVKNSEECSYLLQLPDGRYLHVQNDEMVGIIRGPRPGLPVFNSGSGRPVKEAKSASGENVLWTRTETILKNHPRVLLYGPPGTGKTTSAVMVDEPRTLVTTLTEETPAAELRGHFIPKGNEFLWHDGIAIKAWREGLRLVINEPDRGSGDVLTFLYAIADDPSIAKFTLPTGETVRPHEGFQVVLTMNGEPTDLPAALRDRFTVSLHIDEPHPAAIESLPVDLRGPAQRTFLAYDEERSLSVRAWKEFAALRLSLKDEATAAWAVFGDRAADVLNTVRLSTGK